MDRRLRDVQDQQRADGDAELAGGQHQGGVLHRPQGGARGAVAFLGRGSIWDRRAEITANSAPTKKALTTSKTMSQMSPGT
jgi:hypothetical protein